MTSTPSVTPPGSSISDTEYDPKSLSSTALTSPSLGTRDMEGEALEETGKREARTEDEQAGVGHVRARSSTTLVLETSTHPRHDVDEKNDFRPAVEPAAPSIIVTSLMADPNSIISKRHNRTDSGSLLFDGRDLMSNDREPEKEEDAPHMAGVPLSRSAHSGRLDDEKHDSHHLSLSSPPPSPPTRTGTLPSVPLPVPRAPSRSPSRNPRPSYLRTSSLFGYGSSRLRLTAKKVRSSTELAGRFFNTPALLLLLYFAFSLGLTLYNKAVMVGFPFPYTLTAIHTFCGSVGCLLAMELGYFEPQDVDLSGYLTLGIFSILYTINIAISNISLHMVTVPFHQVVRAATPLFTIAITAIVTPDRRRPGRQRLLSLVPVVAGVGLATYGDYYFTRWGLVLTLLGTFLSACKTVVTNVLQSLPPTGTPLPSGSLKTRPPKRFALQRMQFHPLDLLLRMSPIAFVQCIFYAWLTGELEKVGTFGATQMTKARALTLLMNGVIAFGVNVVSFTANKRTGPLTMTVAANVKQVLTIVLAVVIFDLTITPTHFMGVLFTLVGGAWYAGVEYADRRKASALRGE